MSVLTIDEIPTLTDPVLIVAFAGWNDAGGAATHAAQFLVQQLRARRFASIDPEEFYNFSETRPHVRLRDGLYREITWPANDFFSSTATVLPHGLVIGIGIEPHLKWKTYSAAILDLAKQCGVKMVLTLGALLADVAYSRPVRVAGFASDPSLAARLQLTSSRYEGPTGIVGVFNDACRRLASLRQAFGPTCHTISRLPRTPKQLLPWSIGSKRFSILRLIPPSYRIKPSPSTPKFPKRLRRTRRWPRTSANLRHEIRKRISMSNPPLHQKAMAAAMATPTAKIWKKSCNASCDNAKIARMMNRHVIRLFSHSRNRSTRR